MASFGHPIDPVRQWDSLLSLLTQAQESNPFYQRKFASVGAPRLPQNPADFAVRWPLTTKVELVADQAAFPPYGTVRSRPLGEYTRLHQTSGTTGSPLRWLDTPDSWSALVDDWATVFSAAGVAAGDRVFFAFSFGPFLGFWLAFEAAQRLGCLCLPGGGLSTALRLRMLLDNRAEVLCCTPTYALHLAEVASAEGLDLKAAAVRLILVAGEPGGSDPALRARLSEAWNGARVFDHHGMTEVGPVTYEDPASPGRLLVMEASFFVEVVDPTSGQPIPEGGAGELILTTLRRTASPLIRYRTGDLVRAGRSSPRAPLGLQGGVLGRVDDMVVVRGINVYPTAIDRWVRTLPTIAEYRVTLDERAVLPELSIEVEGPPEAAVELGRLLREELGLRISVDVVPAGTLPRFELKARRWRRLPRAA